MATDSVPMVFREEALLVMKCVYDLSYRCLADPLVAFAMGLDWNSGPARETYAETVLRTVAYKLECIVCFPAINSVV